MHNQLTIDRAALYEQVWSEPIQKLCKQYSLSDRGLGKLCARHNIPVPPRGYWARVAHGQKPKRSSLPPLEQGQANTIYFGKSETEISTPSAPEENLAPEIAFERNPENKIKVPDTLRPDHQLIHSTRRYWAARKRDEIDYGQNTIPYLNIHVSDAALPRALRLTQALLTAAEQRGYTTAATIDGKTVITVQGKSLELSLRELGKQIPHKLTKEEIAYQRKHPWATVTKVDHIQIGDFELKIENAWDIRHTWRDGKTQRLEDRLNQVMEGLIRVAELHRSRDERLEQERIAREAAEKQRREEEERIRQWDEWMKAWKRSQDVRAFAAAIRENLAPIESGSKVEGWLTWAASYADRIDPLRESTSD